MYFLSLLYSFIIKFRNCLYDNKLIKIKKIENLKIICIGNITVGGTGKTPAVQYFANKYLNEGKKVVIVSRGYKGKRKKDPLIVSDGKEIYAKVSECGDEPYTHALNLNIPIVVGVNRYNACMLAKQSFLPDIILLDDGFQHRKLYRDKNIVLIDASNPFGDYYLLPKGKLREDIKGLNRADEFIITKSDMVSKEKLDNIKKVLSFYNKPVKTAIHKAKQLSNLSSKELVNLDFLKNKKVLLFTSIANPENFKKSIEKYQPLEIILYSKPDHSYFKKNDFEYIDNLIIKKNIDIIIVTEKDSVKIEKNINNKDVYYIFKIEFEILE